MNQSLFRKIQWKKQRYSRNIRLGKTVFNLGQNVDVSSNINYVNIAYHNVASIKVSISDVTISERIKDQRLITQLSFFQTYLLSTDPKSESLCLVIARDCIKQKQTEEIMKSLIRTSRNLRKKIRITTGKGEALLINQLRKIVRITAKLFGDLESITEDIRQYFIIKKLKTLIYYLLEDNKLFNKTIFKLKKYLKTRQRRMLLQKVLKKKYFSLCLKFTCQVCSNSEWKSKLILLQKIIDQFFPNKDESIHYISRCINKQLK